MTRSLVTSVACIVTCLGVGTFAFACKKTKTSDPATTTTIGPEPSTMASGSASGKSSATADEGSFKIVATREGPIALGTFQDGNVFAASGVALSIARGNGELVRDPEWTKGLAINGWLGGFALDDVRFGGKFPEDAWISETTQFGRGSSDWAVAHYKDGAWVTVPNHDGKLLWFYAGFGSWKDGQTLALRLNAMPDSGGDGDNYDAMQKLFDAASHPRFEVIGQTKPDATLPAFATGARPQTFASLSTGEAIAVVNFAVGTDEETKVQRWKDGDSKGVVESLPGLTTELVMPLVTMTNANSVWIGGNTDGHSYLAHFDGKTWTRKDGAMKGIIASVAEASDGTTWVVSGPASGEEEIGLGELWKKPKDTDLFEKVSLPKTKFDADEKPHLVLDGMGGSPAWKMSEPDPQAKNEWFLAPRQVVISSSGEVFVMAVGSEDEKSSPGVYATYPATHAVVLRARGVDAPVTLPSRALLVAESEERTNPAIPKALGPKVDCSHFFILAGDVPEGAATDYDPKDLRTALATMKAPGDDTTGAFEVRFEGKRRVGVYVPLCTDDECKKSVDALVAGLTTKLAPQKPTLYCRTPLATRALGITFAP